jgi:hypothetical protein
VGAVGLRLRQNLGVRIGSTVPPTEKDHLGSDQYGFVRRGLKYWAYLHPPFSVEYQYPVVLNSEVI